MTTWTAVADQSTTYEFPADSDNGYVAVGYVQDGYITSSGTAFWSVVADVSTAWA
jgi:hypothetical protein